MTPYPLEVAGQVHTHSRKPLQPPRGRLLGQWACSWMEVPAAVREGSGP